MKAFFSDVISQVKKYSRKVDDLNLLKNNHWVLIDEAPISKTVYIFRSNNELLVSQNGKVEKTIWELIGNNSILIDNKEGSFLFKLGFLDENILALKVDGEEEYVFLINENTYNDQLNSAHKISDFLTSSYINTKENNSLYTNSRLNDLSQNKEDHSFEEAKKSGDNLVTFIIYTLIAITAFIFIVIQAHK